MASPEPRDHDNSTLHTPLYIDDDDDDDDEDDVDADTIAISTAPLVGKPSSLFDIHDSHSDLEDGRHSRTSSTHHAVSQRPWWKKIMARAIRKLTMDDLKNGLDQALLHSEMGVRRSPRRKRTWYNYCIFGGIGGLTILAILLSVNLSLGIATLIWGRHIDTVFKNWGKPGTGTEGLAWYPTDFLRDITPIPCHSHNDYWRHVPLFDALRAGCIGVEADVWLFDDDLYIGHNTASLTRNRTFTSLYIAPLVKILEQQNPDTEFYNRTSHGVFDTDPGKSLTLLVDVKTGGAETWLSVVKQLEPLRERGWLSYVEDDKVHMRPITVVGTGNTPFDVLMQNETYRDTFFDAPLDEMWESRHATPDMKDWPEFDDSLPGERLDEDEGSAEEAINHQATPPSDVGQGMSGVLPTDEFNELNSYYASVSFNKAVGKMWRGRLSPRQMRIIRGQVRGAHRRGLKARYWDLPSWPIGLRNHVWDVLVREGVDMLNVDDLRAASKQVW